MRDALDRDRMLTQLVLSAIAAILALSLLAPFAAAEDDGQDNPDYWEVHAAIMGLAGLLFVLASAFSVLKFLKEKRRVQVHVAIGALAGAVAVSGIALSWWIVERAGRSHFSLTHSVVGYTTLALVLAPLVSGLILTRVKGKKRKKVLMAHIVLAVATIVAMVIAGAMGAELD